MWLFDFTNSPLRNIWIVGVMITFFYFTIGLRKLIIHLQSSRSSSREKAEAGVEKHEARKKHEIVVSKSDDINNNYNRFSVCVIRTFAFEELRIATRNFRIRIGVGGTSYVYLAEIGAGRFGAVKRVMEERGGSRKIFLDEVSVLLRISHPNLVGLYGFCMEKEEQLLLLEYVPNKSLFDRLHTCHGKSMGVLSWSSRLNIALGIAKALDYLHSIADPPVIHRDVKSSNILLVDDNHAKLADFGLCKLGHDAQSALTPTSIKGSIGYVDINYINTGRVSPKSDVYSYGVLLLELITGLKSIQGSETLPDWTEECRKSEDSEIMMKMLDPTLEGGLIIEQLKVLISIANSALLQDCEARPNMGQIVLRITTCMEAQQQNDLPV